MNGTIFQQSIDTALLIRRTILANPSGPNSEFLESEHVSNWNVRNDGTKQIRVLISCGSYNSASIRTTIDSSMFRIRVAILMKIFSSISKVIKNVLSFLSHTLFMPFFSVVTTASYGSNCVHSVQIVHPDHT
jgi:hypothetical protein